MKQMKLTIESDGKTHAMTLNPVLRLRLRAYAQVNKLSELKMIERAMWFAIGSEETSEAIKMTCADEKDIIKAAGDMLAAA